jgi:hypothetical protein
MICSGNSDLNNGLEFGWLYSLSVMTKQPYRQQILYSQDNTTVIDVIFTVRKIRSKGVPKQMEGCEECVKFSKQKNMITCYQIT